jgi:acylphosphatase
MGKRRVKIIVKGLVQGVYFRATTRQQARQLNVTGWVKNRWDGSVEILAEGNKEKLDRLIAWCHKGPSGASIEGVKVEWQSFLDEFQDFIIAY